MDLFGKILVLVVFGMSLLMAAVGGVMFYYRVDWSDTPAAADGSTRAGELVAREENVDKLRGKVDSANKRAWAEIDAAGLAWSEARAALPPAEVGRKLDRAWYADELEHLKTNTNNKPILALDYKDGGSVRDPDKKDVDDANNKDMRLKMVPVADRYGQALLSRDAYAAEVAKKDDAIGTAFDGLIASSLRDTELTLELTGPAGVSDLVKSIDAQLKAYEPKADDDAGTAALKQKLTDLLTKHKEHVLDLQGATNFARGLDQRVQDEKAKQKDLADELKLVLLAEGQVRADSQLLAIRNKELHARVDFLKNLAGKTSKP